MLDGEVKIEEPTDLSALLDLLNAYPGRATIIAGGTDVVVDMKTFGEMPELLVSLARVPGLQEIQEKDGELLLGALLTPNEIAGSDIVDKRLPALAEAARSMGAFQIRNLATLGGNICRASPSADLPPTLIAAGAEAVILGQKGERRMPVRQIFKGVRETALAPSEVLTQIVIPQQPPRSGISYKPFKLRAANALAVASAAARITLDDEGRIADAVVVLGAVAPIPMVAEKSSAMLSGKEPSPSLFEKAAEEAGKEARPISDVRGSETHRRSLVTVLTRRALEEALSRARGDGSV
jgi:carbon-monoxide dehydrogenase medium subunit